MSSALSRALSRALLALTLTLALLAAVIVTATPAHAATYFSRTAYCYGNNWDTGKNYTMSARFTGYDYGSYTVVQHLRLGFSSGGTEPASVRGHFNGATYQRQLNPGSSYTFSLYKRVGPSTAVYVSGELINPGPIPNDWCSGASIVLP